MNRFLDILNKLRRPKSGSIIPASLLASVGAGTMVQPGFMIEIRNGPKRNRVTVGKNSVLSCHITLERDIGEVFIGDDTFIGNSHIICAEKIRIGSNVLISWGCTIVDHDSHTVNWQDRSADVKRWRQGLQSSINVAAASKNWGIVPMAPILISDKVWIGFNVIILKGVVIGEGVVVAAGSVVTREVPAWTVVGGNPARVIKELAPDAGRRDQI